MGATPGGLSTLLIACCLLSLASGQEEEPARRSGQEEETRQARQEEPAESAVGPLDDPLDDPLDGLRNAIPGEPGTDYPIMAATQETGFSCEGLVFGGYYADPSTECQQYSVCLQDPIDYETLYPVNFLCPNGTIFNQQLFNCDWWFNVDCLASEGLYGAAEGAFGSSGGSGDGGGSCPAAAPGSPDECAGAVSTCWSPGQQDTDCPNNGLCCFDGCANICDGAPEVEAEALADPVIIAPTTEGYEYEVPEVTLPVRPADPVTTPRPTTPQALYGAPPAGRRGRNGRRLSQRRSRKQGRRVKNARSARHVVFI